MRTWIEDPGKPIRDDECNTGEYEDKDARDKDGDEGHLHLEDLDLLGQILRGPPDHQAGDEYRNNDKCNHAGETGTDTAEDDFPDEDQEQGDQTTEGG